MIIDDIILSTREPQSTGVIWAKPEGDKVELRIFNNGKWVNTGGASGAAVSTSSSELKSLKDAGKLAPGSLYRITDYDFDPEYLANKCDVDPAAIGSGNHPFDIIVMATSENSLSNTAWAAQPSRMITIPSNAIEIAPVSKLEGHGQDSVDKGTVYDKYLSDIQDYTFYRYPEMDSTEPFNFYGNNGVLKNAETIYAWKNSDNQYIYTSSENNITSFAVILRVFRDSSVRFAYPWQPVYEDTFDPDPSHANLQKQSIYIGYTDDYFRYYPPTDVPLHKDDYFSECNLEAWELKIEYLENGKVAITHMKDEHNNQCDYDFKNALIKVGKAGGDWPEGYENLADEYINVADALSEDYKMYYTFSTIEGSDASMVRDLDGERYDAENNTCLEGINVFIGDILSNNYVRGRLNCIRNNNWIENSYLYGRNNLVFNTTVTTSPSISIKRCFLYGLKFVDFEGDAFGVTLMGSNNRPRPSAIVENGATSIQKILPQSDSIIEIKRERSEEESGTVYTMQFASTAEYADGFNNEQYGYLYDEDGNELSDAPELTENDIIKLKLTNGDVTLRSIGNFKYQPNQHVVSNRLVFVGMSGTANIYGYLEDPPIVLYRAKFGDGDGSKKRMMVKKYTMGTTETAWE